MSLRFSTKARCGRALFLRLLAEGNGGQDVGRPGETYGPHKAGERVGRVPKADHGTPVRTGRLSDISTDFSLPRHHRLRLLGGDCTPIHYMEPKVPKGCEPGANYVLSWVRSSRTRVGDVVLEFPRRPLRWLTVTDIKRHRLASGWVIRFNLDDLRDPELYMACGPGDDGTGYTASKLHALEPVKVVHPVFQERLSRKANDEWAPIRLERAIAERGDWKRTREAARRERRALEQYLAA